MLKTGTKLCSTRMTLFQTCLTIGPVVQLFQLKDSMQQPSSYEILSVVQRLRCCVSYQIGNSSQPN